MAPLWQTPPTAPDDVISRQLDAIGRAPSPQRIEADIRKLVSFGTRHTLSDTTSKTRGIGAATRWIFDEFTRMINRIHHVKKQWKNSTHAQRSGRIAEEWHAGTLNANAARKGGKSSNVAN